MSEIAYEAETVINFNEQDSKASIYTASKRVAALLDVKNILTNSAHHPGG